MNNSLVFSLDVTRPDGTCYITAGDDGYPIAVIEINEDGGVRIDIRPGAGALWLTCEQLADILEKARWFRDRRTARQASAWRRDLTSTEEER